MKNKLHYLNKEALQAFLSYTLLFILLSYLIISKKYLQLVVPRLVPFLVFMIFILCLFMVDSFKNLFRKKYKYNCQKYAPLFAVFFLLMFLSNHDLSILQYPNLIAPKRPISQNIGKVTPLPSKTLTVDEEAKKTILEAMKIPAAPTNKIAVKQPKSTEETVKEVPKAPALAVVSNKSLDDFIFDDEIIEQIPIKQEANNANLEPIILNSNNFYNELIKITNKIDDYQGQTLIIEGYILRDKTLFSTGDFYLARMAMTCCIADIMPFGLVCFAHGKYDYPDGTWIHAEGKITKTTFFNMPQAGLKLEKVKVIEPIEGYIYP